MAGWRGGVWLGRGGLSGGVLGRGHGAVEKGFGFSGGNGTMRMREREKGGFVRGDVKIGGGTESAKTARAKR